jgi:iduronate 2-sulfatase
MNRLRCSVLVLASLLAGTLLARGIATAAAPARPNVLLICVDDLKPALGCYGDKLASTPNIDRLASRGLLFRAAYCNQAVCAPSRNSLLTGLRPQSLGIYDLGTHFRTSVPDVVTLPQYFKQQGYRTEALGKIFHVGHGNHEDPASWSVPHFKSDVIFYALRASKSPQGLTREEALFSNQPAGGLTRGAAFEAADVADDAYPDGAMATEAIKRLRAASEHSKEPFFIALGFVKPHLPFCAPKKYWDLHDPEKFKLREFRRAPEGAPKFAPQYGGELRQYRDVPEQGALSDDLRRNLIHGYYSAASYMDAQLGRVLDTFEELGLEKNTIVVLWGDHGWHLGDHGMWCKHTNYEQAARIPLIVVAPGVQSGGETSALVETVDLYPTVTELAGLPARDNLDGKSLVAVLQSPKTDLRDHVIHVYPRGERLGRAVRTSRYRLVEWKKPGASAETAILELYDYEADPMELKNRAAERPEVVTELRKLLEMHPEAKPQIRS